MEPTNEGGRPPFAPTDEQRSDVRLLKADGWSDDRIARRIGVSRSTLLKYFADELENGADYERHDALRLLKETAEKHNVAAIKELLRVLGIGSAADQFLQDRPRASTAQPKLGKKEQALADAKSPDTTTEIGQLMARRLH